MCSWVLAETGNFFLDHTYEDGSYDGFADPWEDDIIQEGTEEQSSRMAGDFDSCNPSPIELLNRETTRSFILIPYVGAVQARLDEYGSMSLAQGL